jgi:hypothetical protein
MKITTSFLLVCSALFLTTGCKYFAKKPEQPVARVFDKYLFPSDLDLVVPEEASREDSMDIARIYVETWVKKQLMLYRAELALSSEQKDFERQIEDYRTSLLIYSYKQKLLEQKLDTAVSFRDIQEYYTSNQGNFILNEDIVKASFVKVPRSSPDISSVRRWSRSGTDEDLDNLEKYSIQYADKFDTFGNQWIEISTILDKIPFTSSQISSYLRYNKNIETSDSAFYYFVHFFDHLEEGEVSPLEIVREDIRSILLNKRKIEFYHDLENQVYSEGVNRNQFEIY